MDADLAFALPTPEDLAGLSVSSFGYALPAHQLPVYHQIVCGFLKSCNGLKIDPRGSEMGGDSFDSRGSKPGSIKPQEFGEPRKFTLLPASSAENPYGAWTLRCHLTQDAGLDSTASALPLKGKRVAVKDTIPIRGLPMYSGTPFSFTPHADSPLVSRCLAAGAAIVGKAQCEYMCLSVGSHTASAGVVRNPLAIEYHAGGSSSGNAVLVASGEADLSIGCDQGGSCRIPSALNGVVGCKPTHGLVPYTLIDSMYGPIDHAGPITRTVEDNALLLGVLAGWDGVDERASSVARRMETVDYCAGLKGGVQGMRIGVVKEGLEVPIVEEDVVEATKDAAELLRHMGAVVESVSVPLHRAGGGIWVLYVLANLVKRLFWSSERGELVGVDEQGRLCNRLVFLREHLLEDVASWSIPFRIVVLTGEWLRTRFPEAAKVGEVYRQRLIDSYASALSSYDVLLMPTVGCKAKKLPNHLSTAEDYENASAELVAEHDDVENGLTVNTGATNVTGHPAVCVTVGGGIVAFTDQGVASNVITKPVALPVSVMLVGNYFQEATLYRVAYTLEQARPWRSFLYHEGRPQLQAAS